MRNEIGGMWQTVDAVVMLCTRYPPPSVLCDINSMYTQTCPVFYKKKLQGGAGLFTFFIVNGFYKL